MSPFLVGVLQLARSINSLEMSCLGCSSLFAFVVSLSVLKAPKGVSRLAKWSASETWWSTTSANMDGNQQLSKVTLTWFASERTFSELANTVGVDMVKGCSSSPWWENMASWASINPVKSEYGTFLCSINFLPDLVALKLLSVCNKSWRQKRFC